MGSDGIGHVNRIDLTMPRLQSDLLPRTVAGRRLTSETRPAHQPSASAHQHHSDRDNRETANDPPRRFLTGPQVCSRYSITDMSLWRWLKDPMIGFPQPTMRVKYRRYWLEADLIAWEHAQLPRYATCPR
jgi:predicted DNA-binding transcriptional regulator AlpA